MKIPENIKATHGADGAVLLDVDRGRLFQLNPTGSRVLLLLEEGYTESQIVTVICQESGADAAQVGRDVREFIACLVQHHLFLKHGITKLIGRE